MKETRVVFMGTPEFAVPILKSLVENVEVVLVISQPDKPVGRKREITPSPVKKFALEHGIEVVCPVKIREDYGRILELEPDIIVTCAYGQIIPKEVLSIPKLGPINVHASLLPKLRGGAPIHRAIMEGYDKSGITIMYMDEGMDSGDIISQREVMIEEDDTLDTLSAKLMKVGSELLIETLPSIIEGTNARVEQNVDEVTFGYIIKKEDELLNFDDTTENVYNKIRALNSTPGAYFLMDGKHVKVYASRKNAGKKCTVSTICEVYPDGIGVGTQDGEIILTEIKPEGKGRVLVKDYLNGVNRKTLEGMRLNDKMD